MTAGSQREQRLHAVRSHEHIDGFVVGALLSEGGMARLYRCTQRGARLPLVMKVPRLEHGAPLSALGAFENELRILERLKGPHVPRLVGHGDLRRAPYLVMEYIAGDAFAQAAERAPLPAEEVAALGIALCRAVHDIHRQNVIHLDLNPRNVRTRADGSAVLIDFGIAHHAMLPDLIDTAFGEAEGTTPYIAPEQVKHLRSESRSDIYAIGAILYRLATGAYPFGRPNLLSVHKRLFQPPLPPRAHTPEIPAWLQEIILRCLEIRPDDRYATAKRVAYALSHPEVVHLTHRAHGTRSVGWLTRARLWWRSLYQVFDEGEVLRPAERLTHAPHVLVALDLGHSSATLNQAMRVAVRKFARNETHGYFTFLTVLPAGGAAAAGTRRHERSAAERVIEMRNWAQSLHLRAGRASFHVAMGDPARVIVDYARQHALDYIIMGARGASAARRFLGSVSARVVPQAPCSVTVVRARDGTAIKPASRRRKK
jgi:nucleotide-binding universal stress UspA family protein/predicted Ser/Thr protein kinase